MDPFKQLERKKAYSARSQASWDKQRELEHDLHMCMAWLMVAEKNVKELKEAVARIEKDMVERGDVSPEHLGDCTRKLEDEQRRFKGLKLRRDQLESQIKNLKHPAPEIAAERLKHQTALGRLASERLEWDRQISRYINRLLQMLKVREKLTAKMQAEAEAIDLRGARGLLDEERFTKLMEALPDDLVDASEAWAARFTDSETGKKSYRVLRSLTLPETLANCHCYEPGDTVRLDVEQASRLLADGSVSDPDKDEEKEAAQSTLEIERSSARQRVNFFGVT